MYVGIPFKEKGRDESGLDCWGLVRLWYDKELGIELPSYIDVYQTTKDIEITETIKKEQAIKWESVEKPVRGDVVLLRIKGLPWHVGIYLGDNRILHVEQGCDSVIENLGRSKWKNRILGYYRMR